MSKDDWNEYQRGEALHNMDNQTASENDAKDYYESGLIDENEYNSYVGEDD